MGKVSGSGWTLHIQEGALLDVEGRLHGLLGSPDLTPMEVFLWGHLKEQVYAVPPRTIEDLVARLQAAVTTVDANILRCVRQNAVRRAAVCLEMDGGRFEHLL
jgi:hypothetical protein